MITVTMLANRVGEDGSLWQAGQSYSASIQVAQYLIGAGLATGTLPTVPRVVAEVEKVNGEWNVVNPETGEPLDEGGGGGGGAGLPEELTPNTVLEVDGAGEAVCAPKTYVRKLVDYVDMENSSPSSGTVDTTVWPYDISGSTGVAEGTRVMFGNPAAPADSGIWVLGSMDVPAAVPVTRADDCPVGTVFRTGEIIYACLGPGGDYEIPYVVTVRVAGNEQRPQGEVGETGVRIKAHALGDLAYDSHEISELTSRLKILYSFSHQAGSGQMLSTMTALKLAELLPYAMSTAPTSAGVYSGSIELAEGTITVANGLVLDWAPAP